MKLGFTGTRKGITPEQKAELIIILDNILIDQFHHGDCVGADEAAHEIALACEIRYIEIHPPKLDQHRAFCYHDKRSDLTVVVHKPDEYMNRNRKIVFETDGLVATPSGPEVQRSGTWSTIRYAMKEKKPVLIIWPDGKQETRV